MSECKECGCQTSQVIKGADVCERCEGYAAGQHDSQQSISSIQQQLAALEEENERLKAQVAKLVEATTKVRYIDGLGAGRSSPADCRDGISYVIVADTVYWPLSAEDAQLLRSAECGMGDFTGPAHRPIAAAPDVSALVEALEEGLRAIGDHHAPGDCYATGPMTSDPFRDLVQCPACSFIAMCDDLLAAHRKGVQP